MDGEKEGSNFYIWINGELVKGEEAKIHVMSSAVHYGFAVFEGIRAYAYDKNLYVFRLKEHLQRLFESAKIYHMKIPYEEAEMFDSIVETIKSNDLHANCYIRPIAYGGVIPGFELGYSHIDKAPVGVSIMVRPRRVILGTDEFRRGKKAIVSSWRRFSPDAIPPVAKCAANYVNSFLASRESKKAEVDYAIMLDKQGFVSEGGGQNIFVIKDGHIITPPIYASILGGITRKTLISIGRDLGYTIEERNITRGELYVMDEIFLCGTGTEVMPIVEVDDVKISDEAGSVTTKIASYYRQVVTGRISEYQHWLTAVY